MNTSRKTIFTLERDVIITDFSSLDDNHSNESKCICAKHKARHVIKSGSTTLSVKFSIRHREIDKKKHIDYPRWRMYTLTTESFRKHAYCKQRHSIQSK